MPPQPTLNMGMSTIENDYSTIEAQLIDSISARKFEMGCRRGLTFEQEKRNILNIIPAQLSTVLKLQAFNAVSRTDSLFLVKYYQGFRYTLTGFWHSECCCTRCVEHN